MKDITFKPGWFFHEAKDAFIISRNQENLPGFRPLTVFPSAAKNSIIHTDDIPHAGIYLPEKMQLLQFLKTGEFSFSENLYQQPGKEVSGTYLLKSNEIKSILPSEKLNKIAIIGLGNVGSTLLQGLVLSDPSLSRIEEIIILDTNQALLKRWEVECNQINSPQTNHPKVTIGHTEDLSEVDMILFCVTSGVPKLGEEEKSDVRLSQFAGNSAILKSYLNSLMDAGYRGLFAVMSDPVDHLTRFALEYAKGKMDPSQFVGLGHGVMFARAHYLVPEKDKRYLWATGTHGDLAFIIDDIRNFNEKESVRLTRETISLNIRVRELGYLPYVAPGMSSGVLSVISLLNGQPFFGALWNGKMVWGSKIIRKDGFWGWLPLGNDPRLSELLDENQEKIDSQYKQLLKNTAL